MTGYCSRAASWNLVGGASIEMKSEAGLRSGSQNVGHLLCQGVLLSQRQPSGYQNVGHLPCHGVLVSQRQPKEYPDKGESES